MDLIDFRQRNTIKVITLNNCTRGVLNISSAIITSTRSSNCDHLTIGGDCRVLNDLIFNLQITLVEVTDRRSTDNLVELRCIIDLNRSSASSQSSRQCSRRHFRDNAFNLNVVTTLVHTVVSMINQDFLIIVGIRRSSSRICVVRVARVVDASNRCRCATRLRQGIRNIECLSNIVKCQGLGARLICCYHTSRSRCRSADYITNLKGAVEDCRQDNRGDRLRRCNTLEGIVVSIKETSRPDTIDICNRNGLRVRYGIEFSNRAFCTRRCLDDSCTNCECIVLIHRK